MFEQAYGAVLVIVAGSIIVGRAICMRCGGAQRWSAAPFVGFATLMALANATIKLPGRADTAVVCCGAAVIVSALYLAWHARLAPMRWRSRLARPATDAAIGAVALFAASIPFIGQGRVGPGALVDNDMSNHLIWAEALRSAQYSKIYSFLTSEAYPLGPHSLVAVVGTAIGASLIQVFAGLLMSVMVLTAIVAGDMLRKEAAWRRAVVGVISGTAYLAAAYYGEGSFKETIMAGLVLAFALHLAQIRDRWAAAPRVTRFTMLLPAAALLTGAIYTYSYLGIAWFLATVVVWAAIEVAARPALAREVLSARNLEIVAPWGLGLIALELLALAPIAPELSQFFGGFGFSPAGTAAFTTGILGNLSHPLSAYQALGIWPSADFRQNPGSQFDAGELAALALAILAFGVIWSVRHRRWPVLSAGLGCALVWLYSDATQSPYVTAKALVIGSPIVIAIGLRALLTSRQGGRLVAVILLTVAGIFGYAAAESSYTSLRNEPVQSSETVAELASFHRITGNTKILFLGIDDWALWELHDATVADLTPGTEYIGGVQTPVNKPFDGEPMDFDSVPSTELDQFAYVVTTNTDFASQAPSNFHLVARRRLYELWKRVGPTPAYASIEGPGQPGAVLRCDIPVLRNISRERGVAALMAQPIQVPGAQLTPGRSARVEIPLPRGAWELSIQYIAWTPMTFAVQGQSYWMPAYMGRNGPFFNLGSVTGAGLNRPLTVEMHSSRPSILTGSQPYDAVYNIVATRLPDRRTIVPLRSACGRYVDWFRTS